MRMIFFFFLKKQQQRGLFNLFFYLKKKEKKRKERSKHIVAMKKWVSGTVVLFYRKCFRWELEIYFYGVILKFSPYLNVGYRKILKNKNKNKIKKISSRGSPINNSIEDGMGIFSNKAAMISPWDFRITTPIPSSWEPTKMAPSKFVFN